MGSPLDGDDKTKIEKGYALGQGGLTRLVL